MATGKRVPLWMYHMKGKSMNKIFIAFFLFSIPTISSIRSCIADEVPRVEDIHSSVFEVAKKAIKYFSQHPSEELIDDFFEEAINRNEEEYGGLRQYVHYFFDAIGRRAFPEIKKLITINDNKKRERIYDISVRISYELTKEEFYNFCVNLLNDKSYYILINDASALGLSIAKNKWYEKLDEVMILLRDPEYTKGVSYVLSIVSVISEKKMFDPNFILDNLDLILNSINENKIEDYFPQLFLLSRFFENNLFNAILESKNTPQIEKVKMLKTWLKEKKDDFYWNEEKGFFVLENE